MSILRMPARIGPLPVMCAKVRAGVITKAIGSSMAGDTPMGTTSMTTMTITAMGMGTATTVTKTVSRFLDVTFR